MPEPPTDVGLVASTDPWTFSCTSGASAEPEPELSMSSGALFSSLENCLSPPFVHPFQDTQNISSLDYQILLVDFQLASSELVSGEAW